MAKKSNYKNLFRKKGLSTIVTTLILVVLSMAAVVLVWGLVNNMIKNQISNSQACFGNYDKIKIDGQYTCYERISASNYNLRFSLSIGDVSVDKVIVGVSSAGETKSYIITDTPEAIAGLVMYSGINPTDIILPSRNAGLTYNATGFTGKIDSIQIVPVIGGNTCPTSDSIQEIEDCALMA